MADVRVVDAERETLVKASGITFAGGSEWTNEREELTILNSSLPEMLFPFQYFRPMCTVFV